MKDVSKLWSAGYALGASLENTLVVADDRLLNPEGLRYADEFVRHKALDAIGDLALAGAPLLGAYKSVCGGHKLNHAILCALIADPTAWTVVEAKALRRTHHSQIFIAGMFIAAFVLIPIVNLATPLFGTAFMVHMHKRLAGSSRRELVEARS